jgi:hypothetical protein
MANTANTSANTTPKQGVLSKLANKINSNPNTPFTLKTAKFVGSAMKSAVGVTPRLVKGAGSNFVSGHWNELGLGNIFGSPHGHTHDLTGKLFGKKKKKKNKLKRESLANPRSTLGINAIKQALDPLEISLDGIDGSLAGMRNDIQMGNEISKRGFMALLKTFNSNQKNPFADIISARHPKLTPKAKPAAPKPDSLLGGAPGMVSKIMSLLKNGLLGALGAATALFNITKWLLNWRENTARGILRTFERVGSLGRSTRAAAETVTPRPAEPSAPAGEAPRAPQAQPETPRAETPRAEPTARPAEAPRAETPRVEPTAPPRVSPEVAADPLLRDVEAEIARRNAAPRPTPVETPTARAPANTAEVTLPELSVEPAKPRIGVAGKLGRLLAKVFGAETAVVIEGASDYVELQDAYDKYTATPPTMTKQQFKKIASRVVGKSIGGLGGMAIGGAAGAKLGALGGTFVAPGLGTAIGGFAGGLIGGTTGYFVGRNQGKVAAKKLDSAIDAGALDDAPPTLQAAPTPQVQAAPPAALNNQVIEGSQRQAERGNQSTVVIAPQTNNTVNNNGGGGSSGGRQSPGSATPDFSALDHQAMGNYIVTMP